MSVRQDRRSAARSRAGQCAVALVPETVYLPDLNPADDLAWQDKALCAQSDGEAWFPEKGGSTRLPKQICRACPVRMECLDYAMEHDLRHGVWGGLSERERHRLKCARLKEAA